MGRQLSEKLVNENSKLDELKLALEIETQHLQELPKIRIAADISHILSQEHIIQNQNRSFYQKYSVYLVY